MPEKNKLPLPLTQNLSSSTLFYFTDSLDYIIDIVKNGFLCRYTFEKLPSVNLGYIAPIKCFCDTPLTLIKPHLSWYGNYGIGFNKSYGFRLGITPVIYIPRYSPIADHITLSNTENILERDPILPYYKRYYGSVIDKNGNETSRRFYDEREWRYFPADGSIELVDSTNKLLIKRKIISYNSNLPKRLKLNLKYLEYIIVDKPTDLKKLLSSLHKIALKKKIVYEDLVSKILTARQIRRDF